MTSPEAGTLAQELTVGETYFFRNGDQFRAFEHILGERMQSRAASRRLAFLSAGCSSGEEAFSIAMLARATIPSPPWQVAIRAVDLNPAALRKAACGRFGSWSLRETPAHMLQQWFRPDGNDMVLSKDLRNSVQFDRRNLADPDSDIWQSETYDAIFCRNVIMYLTPATQQAVIGRLARSLVPGGYLFLGHAETLRGLSQDFHLVHTHNTFYYQRKSGGDIGAPLPYRGAEIRSPYPATGTPMPAGMADTSWYHAIGEASRRIEALTQPAPAEPDMPRPSPHWNLEIALDLFQRERFAEALQLIDRMPREASEDPDVLLLQALLFVQGGQPSAGAEICRTLLAQDELNAAANYVLALCFEGTGDSASAVVHYGIASHLDPLFAMPLLRRGVLARRSGNFAGAKHDLGLAQQLLQSEDTSRLLLFGGGFTRGALSKLCAFELEASMAQS